MEAIEERVDEILEETEDLLGAVFSNYNSSTSYCIIRPLN